MSFASASPFVSIRGRCVGVVELGLFSGVGGALSALEHGGGDGVGRRFEDAQLGDAALELLLKLCAKRYFQFI